MKTICIGNGQLHDALSPSYEVCKTLNCMEDPMKILIVSEDETSNNMESIEQLFPGDNE